MEQLPHGGVVARLADIEAGCVSVGLAVLAEMFEAGVAVARACRAVRIDTIEVAQDRIYRGVEAVEVQAVETGWTAGLCVAPLEPLEEFDHDGIPPHPGREAREPLQGIGRGP